MKMKKIVSAIAALSLVAALAVGGTLAWLTANTKTITNTFTIGNVGIKLLEKDYATGGDAWLDASTEAKTQEFKLVPGEDVDKEAKAAVTAGSEKSIVYLKVTKGNTFDTYFNAIDLDDSWTEVTGHAGYYYQVVDAVVGEVDEDLPILSTLSPIDEKLENNVDLSGATLAFQVAAVQYEGLESGNEIADGFSKLPGEFTGAQA